jgi:hypothetical protein
MAFMKWDTPQLAGVLLRSRQGIAEYCAAGVATVLFATACGGEHAARGAARPTAAPPATDEVVWNYEVTMSPATGHVMIDATFKGPVTEFALAPEIGEIEEFTILPATWKGSRFEETSFHAGRLPFRCGHDCRIRYGFLLGEAARAIDDVDVAFGVPHVKDQAPRALFAPPSTWLAHPEPYSPNGRYRFHVNISEGAVFSTGIRRAPSGAPNTFEAPINSFEESSFAGFGPLLVTRLAEPAIDLISAPGIAIPNDAIIRWANLELGIVTGYFHRAPTDALALFVVPGTSEVMRGKTLAGGGASVLVRVGTTITEAALKDDWVLCHELIHVAFPSTDREQAWFSEGLASYVEPIIRARAGLISEEKFWADLVEGLPQGLPKPGDKGLENNHAWGRVYWGGSLFFLLADLAIREKTSGARSLDDAVLAVANGKNVETFVPMDDIIDNADRATGTRVFHDLYERLARKPGTEDLGALWRRLGVVRDGKTVRFDDGALGATVRRSITKRSDS